ncbi:MAG TPA: hypothetical protein VL135_06225 [Terracidiphilus sp.]|nr:hypothetical protein [Terracidiphilus sp.]
MTTRSQRQSFAVEPGSPSLILALRTNAFGNPERLDLSTTAATTSFSVILGGFNVICLTLQVDQITGEDAEVRHCACR